jgi:hypothetical protein
MFYFTLIGIDCKPSRNEPRLPEGIMGKSGFNSAFRFFSAANYINIIIIYIIIIWE